MQLAGQSLTAFSMTTEPPLDTPDDADERIERIKQHSRMTYARYKDEVDAELMSRYGQNDPDVADDDEDSYFD